MADNVVTRVVAGAAAGIAGTLALQGAMNAQKKFAPDSMPPMRQDPAEFILEQLKRWIDRRRRDAIPENLERLLGKSLHLGYGITFGESYAAVRGKTPRGVLSDGVLLGLVVWAAGYLGWLPAAGISPKPWELTPRQLAGPIATHIVYGIATVTAYHQLTLKRSK